MKTQAFFVSISLLLAGSAFAAGGHDHKPLHGGVVVDATGSFNVGPDTKAMAMAVVTVSGEPATAHFTLK